MIDLDQVRKEFAEFLQSDPQGRWRMDAALAHVITKAYEQGLKDANQADPQGLPLPGCSTRGSV